MYVWVLALFLKNINMSVLIYILSSRTADTFHEWHRKLTFFRFAFTIANTHTQKQTAHALSQTHTHNPTS